MKYVSRREWGAKYPQGSGSIPGPVHGVTIHWEGPHMGAWSHDQCAGKVRVIERFHAVTRGWAGIAYSALVCPHGYVFEGRGVHVRTAANGTSGIGGNDHWYAVCFLSGQGDPFTAEAQAGVIAAVQWLRAKGGAGHQVNGHRDHHPTECPGDVVYRWLQTADFGSKGTAAQAAGSEDDMTPEQDKRLAFVEAEAKHQRSAVKSLNGKADRIAKALTELAKALGPTVESAVESALADAVVNVDVNVSKAGE